MLRSGPLSYCSAILVLFAFSGSCFAQTFLGPSPYLQRSDSPLKNLSGFTLEDFEDGALNIPGVTADFGSVIGPSAVTDSVDGDDGNIDGSGAAGHSWFNSNAGQGVTFSFNATQIGFLPKSVGIVWTDGDNPINFEAFDTSGHSLGTLTGNHADGSFTGETAEDRFYGVSSDVGIGSIRLSSTGGGGIEMDHVQYAADPVPEPIAATVMLPIGFMLLFRRHGH